MAQDTYLERGEKFQDSFTINLYVFNKFICSHECVFLQRKIITVDKVYPTKKVCGDYNIMYLEHIYIFT